MSCEPRTWGEGLEAEALKQMADACRLPVSLAGALMPDAHVGYGLPIGGVLATDNAIIPYGVGVDIACRMKMSVLDWKPSLLAGMRDRLANILQSETRFGVGATFEQPRSHPVLDEDWTVSPVTSRCAIKPGNSSELAVLAIILSSLACSQRRTISSDWRPVNMSLC